MSEDRGELVYVRCVKVGERIKYGLVRTVAEAAKFPTQAQANISAGRVAQLIFRTFKAIEI